VLEGSILAGPVVAHRVVRHTGNVQFVTDALRPL
jgi:hypothetical protein